MNIQTFKTTAAILCLALGIGTASAQPPSGDAHRDTTQSRHPRFAEMPNPEKKAKEQTDRLKDVLQLTDKQYKKIYKLNLKEQKSLFENRPQRPGGMPPHPMGGMPPSGEGFMPPSGQGFMPPAMDGERRPDLHKEQAEKMKKQAEKKDKKMKKILTDEQYARWKALPPERPDKAPMPGKEEKEKKQERHEGEESHEQPS